MMYEDLQPDTRRKLNQRLGTYFEPIRKGSVMLPYTATDLFIEISDFLQIDDFNQDIVDEEIADWINSYDGMLWLTKRTAKWYLTFQRKLV